MHSGKSSLHLTPKITTTSNQLNYTMCKIQNNQNIIFYILYIKSTIKQGKNHTKTPQNRRNPPFLPFSGQKAGHKNHFFTITARIFQQKTYKKTKNTNN